MSSTSLKKILDLIQISRSDSDCLREKYGICSLHGLLAIRQRLALNSSSKTCRLLLACIDFINERRKTCEPTYEDSEAYKFFIQGTPVMTSWEYFLALQYDFARQHIETMKCDQKAASVGKNMKRLSDEKGFRNGDQYWQDVELQQAESPVASLGHGELFNSDSLWSVSEDSNEVILKALPEIVRIPLQLFTKLYDYQRDGIAWMAELYNRETGGILGE
jgi:hypothetical protein